MKGEEGEQSLLYKLVLVGDSGVGKTNLMTRFVKEEFLVESKTTIGVEFSNKVVALDGRQIKVQVWDTAGQERYRSIVSSYYRGAVGSMLVYDISRASSFESIEKWLKEIKNYGDEHMVTMLVGNKSDLKHVRSIRTENAEEYAKSRNMIFIQTSALDSTNVEEAFEALVKEIYERQSKAPPPPKPEKPTAIKRQTKVQGEQLKKKKKCC